MRDQIMTSVDLVVTAVFVGRTLRNAAPSTAAARQLVEDADELGADILIGLGMREYEARAYRWRPVLELTGREVLADAYWLVELARRELEALGSAADPRWPLTRAGQYIGALGRALVDVLPAVADLDRVELELEELLAGDERRD